MVYRLGMVGELSSIWKIRVLAPRPFIASAYAPDTELPNTRANE
jgi:hypothetical protein